MPPTPASTTPLYVISGVLRNNDGSNPGIRNDILLLSAAGQRVQGPISCNAAGEWGFAGVPDGSYQLTRKLLMTPGSGWTLANPTTPGELSIKVTVVNGQPVTGIVIRSMATPTPKPPVVIAKPDVTAPAPTPAARKIIGGVVDLFNLHTDTPCSGSWGTKPAADVIKAANVTQAGLWLTFDPTGTITLPDWQKKIIPWTQSGVITSIIITLASGNSARVPTPAETAGAIGIVIAGIPAVLKPLISFQVGNEPAVGTKFWTSTLANFVLSLLNPCYDALHAAGYQVILAGLNGDMAGQLGAIKAAGGKFDAIGLHPYCQTLGELDGKLAALDAIDSTTPRHITEEASFTGRQYHAGQMTDADVLALNAQMVALLASRPQTVSINHYSAERITTTTDGFQGWFDITRDAGKVPVSAVATGYFEQALLKAVA